MIEQNPLLRTFSLTSVGWRDFIKLLRNRVTEDELTNGKKMAELVRQFAELPSTCTPSVALSKLRLLFAVPLLRNQSSSSTPDGEGWVQAISANPGSQPAKLIIVAGRGPTNRRTTIFAHEFGHLFYTCLQEIIHPQKVNHRLREQKAERFCWEFAVAFCCPAEVRNTWTLELLNAELEKLDVAPRSELNALGAEADDLISYYHLCALAKRHGISVRMAAMALNNHPLLNQLRCIVSVFRHSVNRSSKKEPGLRLLFQARPPDCYLTPNQRVMKQGFLAAEAAYRDAQSSSLTLATETISVWQLRANRVPRWVQRPYSTPCLYTPVDVRNEGRFLLATIRCPQIA